MEKDMNGYEVLQQKHMQFEVKLRAVFKKILAT